MGKLGNTLELLQCVKCRLKQRPRMRMQNKAFHKVLHCKKCGGCLMKILPKITQSSVSRLTALGFRDYAQYLNSKHWRMVKRQYKESGLLQACAHCGHHQYHLCHLTYERLGCELLTDLVPLCRDCHWRLREHMKSHPFARLSDSLEILRSLQEAASPPQQEHPKGQIDYSHRMSDEEIKGKFEDFHQRGIKA